MRMTKKGRYIISVVIALCILFTIIFICNPPKSVAQYYLSKKNIAINEDSLVNAAFNHNKNQIKLLLKAGVNVNGRNNEGNTALNTAIEYRYKDIADLLVQHEANINLPDEKDYTPLMKAVYDIDLVKFLVKKGADINYKTNDGVTPLFSAVDSGNIETVDYFLSIKANVNDRLHDGTTALMRSMWRIPDKNKSEIVKKLLQHGVDVNNYNNDGTTSLMLAAIFGDEEIITYLVQSGANINAQDQQGKTALMHAIINNKTEEAAALVKNNANISIKDNDNQTALMYAKKYNRQIILGLLKD